ncbi:MAG: hypothetical protein HOP29_04150 [Phycisphaerales bacterium]|nr:hypothetical protein [Phycisphaerales bacterium]
MKRSRIVFIGTGAFLLVGSLATAAQSGAETAERRTPAAHAYQNRYAGQRLARVVVKTDEQRRALESSGATVLNCHAGIGRMRVAATDAQIEFLRGRGLDVVVNQPDLQALIDAQRTPRAAGGDPFDDFFLDYHPYDGGTGSITWYLNELAVRYPTLASTFTIGNTPAGRPIRGVRVTSSVVTDKPAVVYFGAEHAREWIGTTIPAYFAHHLLSQYAIDPEIQDLVDNVEFFLIPVFNVEGYEYTWTDERLWRKNRRDNGDGTFGVDINRNWGEGWGGEGSSGVTSSLTYRGTGPFSEIETQRLRDFFIAHPNLRAQLDIHSFTQLILWPYASTPLLPPDQTYYDQVGKAMKSLIAGVHGLTYTAGPIYTTIYPAAGGSVDWTYVQRGVLSYSYECRDTGEFGFELPADQIIPNNEELLPAVLHLSDSDWVRAPIRMEYPDGVPNRMMVGDPTEIDVRIVNQTGTLEPGTAAVHYRFDGGLYSIAPLTPVAGDLYLATIPATSCGSSPEFYFTAETTDLELYSNPRGGAAEPYTAMVLLGMNVVVAEPMSSDPGWTTEGQWAWGIPTGAGTQNHDPTVGATGSQVYGYNLAGNYPNNLPARYLTSTPFDCTARFGVTLRYQRWLGVESNSNFDQATIEVSSNGVNWTPVWSASDTGDAVSDSAWTLHELDISSVADNQPTVYLRWGMGPTDGGLTYPGWNIDDVEILSAYCGNLEGDVNHDGTVDIFDILCVLDGFAGVFVTCAPEDVDLVPCPDGDAAVDIFDILAVLDAFSGDDVCP